MAWFFCGGHTAAKDMKVRNLSFARGVDHDYRQRLTSEMKNSRPVIANIWEVPRPHNFERAFGIPEQEEHGR
jgi:hypothetical protein